MIKVIELALFISVWVGAYFFFDRVMDVDHGALWMMIGCILMRVTDFPEINRWF